MNFWKAMAGGLLGGGIGAVLWVLVARLTGYHVGFVAWGIGFLAGLGVMIGTRAKGGVGYGVLASAIAVACIMGGKFAEASLEVDRLASEHAHVDETNAVEHLCAEVADEMQSDGTLTDAGWETLGDEETWPRSVRDAAESKWASMDAAERAAFIERRAGENAAEATEYRGVATVVLFLVSFGLWGVLWTGLAIASAYKLGSASMTPEAASGAATLTLGPVTVTETRREHAQIIPVVPGREHETLADVERIIRQTPERPRFTMTGEVVADVPAPSEAAPNDRREAA